MTVEAPVGDDPQNILVADDFTDAASTFGDRLVAAREAIGLTTEELAQRLGVNDETLRNWEDDRAEPRANKLQMLAGLLNVSIIWLMVGSGEGVGIGGDGGPSVATAEDGDNATLRAVLDDIRKLREAHLQLAARTGVVERRLTALLR